MDLTFTRPGAMVDQDMTTFDAADWSEDSHIDECDPGAPLDIVAEASVQRYADFSHGAFVFACRSFPMTRSIVRALMFPRTFALATPTFTFRQLRRSLMKFQGPLANPNGTPCLVSFWPG